MKTKTWLATLACALNALGALVTRFHWLPAVDENLPTFLVGQAVCWLFMICVVWDYYEWGATNTKEKQP